MSGLSLVASNQLSQQILLHLLSLAQSIVEGESISLKLVNGIKFFTCAGTDQSSNQKVSFFFLEFIQSSHAGHVKHQFSVSISLLKNLSVNKVISSLLSLNSDTVQHNILNMISGFVNQNLQRIFK